MSSSDGSRGSSCGRSRATRSPTPRAARGAREGRKHGYAAIDQELEEGLRSLAVPIHDAAGSVVAALNVSAHASRCDDGGDAPRLPAADAQDSRRDRGDLRRARGAATEQAIALAGGPSAQAGSGLRRAARPPVRRRRAAGSRASSRARWVSSSSSSGLCSGDHPSQRRARLARRSATSRCDDLLARRCDQVLGRAGRRSRRRSTSAGAARARQRPLADLRPGCRSPRTAPGCRRPGSRAGGRSASTRPPTGRPRRARRAARPACGARRARAAATAPAPPRRANRCASGIAKLSPIPLPATTVSRSVFWGRIQLSTNAAAAIAAATTNTVLSAFVNAVM